jgi:CHAT domain-containing protein/tetratricopeptide (TPR) repeat protein
MAADTFADRLAAAREALRAAPGPGESLPAIAEMIEVAAEVQDTGGERALLAREVINESIGHLSAAVAGLPATDEDQLTARYLLAEAGLLRAHGPGPVSDLDDAIGYLRELRAALAAGTADRAEVDIELSNALLSRGYLGGRLADLDEAGTLLESVLGWLPPDSPGRGPVTAALAVQRAVRYVLFGGPAADREAALEFAGMCVTAAAGDGAGNAGAEDTGAGDGGTDVAGAGHAVIAWMTLTRQLTAAQRSAMAMRPDVEAARSDAQAGTALLRQLGTYEITAADAATAMTHLRQVPAAPSDDVLSEFVPRLWVMALLAAAQAGDSPLPADQAADARRVADELGQLAAMTPPDDPERGELLAMRAVLLAVGASASSGPAGLDAASGALSEAAAELPSEHLLRSPLLGVLGQTFGHQVDEAASSEDLTGRLAELADAMDRMPHDDPAFAHAMATVAVQMLSVSSSSRSALQQEWLTERLGRIAAGLDPDDPLQPLIQFMLLSARFMHATIKHQTDTADTVIEDLTQCTESVPPQYPARPYMLAGLGLAYRERHVMGGEIRHLQRAEHYLKRAVDEADPDGPFGERGPLRGVLLYFRGHVALVWCYYDPSLDRVTAAIADLERAASIQDLAPSTAPGIAAELEVARMMRARMMLDGEQPMSLAAEERQALDALLDVANRTNRENPQYPALAAQAAGGLMLRGLADHDVKLIDQAIRMLADASQADGLAVRERPRLLELHGQALLTRYSTTRVPSDLSNAIDRLEEARRAVDQEYGSPHAASVLQTLASAYRARGNAARGDVDRAVALGLAGLREHAGDVFLQDNDDNALHIARRGTSDATEMARWFLDRHREQAAVSALELGRGMVLHAATSGAGVAQILREAGHAELAGEWAAQPDQPGLAPAEDLRYRVMLAIEQSPAETRLLSPPPVPDIAAALAATGSDALVYLLPREDTGAGLAVIVDQDGTVRWLPLAGLYTGGASPVSAFLRARRAVEAAATPAATEAARQAWLPVLGTLCGWAWRAVIGPVLDAVQAQGAKPDRRIVLVPLAELGVVPWHAARQPETGRYACQRAAFSYAASARQFVETAQRRPRPWAQDPVLISDAAESAYLTAAGVGYLQSAFYPAAAVFGSARRHLPGTVPGTPAATRDDVLSALPRAGRPGASLLHFGCHGRVQVPVLGSSLSLGTDGHGHETRVEIRDILRQARSGRTDGPSPAHAGGLVVLASCLTDVTEQNFDEALTLAAAFLAAGSAGVVAARWAVADAVTALLMNVFHQMLNGPHPDPAGALRAAQLWLLDPDREVPAGWPKALREEATLASSPGGPDLAGPEAWAGFTYQGR